MVSPKNIKLGGYQRCWGILGGYLKIMVSPTLSYLYQGCYEIWGIWGIPFYTFKYKKLKNIYNICIYGIKI